IVSVPVASIRALWQEFNLCATGWGVCPKFFEQLCEAMAKSMGIESDDKANQSFFGALDTDKNNLVDGLELISTLGMLSGMTRDEKVEFIFSCYDVGGRFALTMNELFLLLKSTSAGLCKLSAIVAPDSERLESIASLVFMHNKTDVEGGLSLDTLASYCDTNPVASSWLGFYDDCEGQRNVSANDEPGGPSAVLQSSAPDIHNEEALFALRSQAQEDANAGTVEENKNAGPPPAPRGAWVDAAKELVPPPPPPEEGEDAADEADAEDDAEQEDPGAAATGPPPPPPPPPPALPAPDTQLSLEWVYGYSAASSRGSACYFSSTIGVNGGGGGDGGGGRGGVGVVYPAGKVAVVLSQPLDEEGAVVEGDRVQSFMQEHTDEITALAVSPCGKWVATGEVGAHPKVVVWNGTTKQIKTMIAGFHTVGIAGLAWSPCGNLLASVGADSCHSLQITEAVLSSSARPSFGVRTGLSRPLGMSWTEDGSALVTCGQTHKDSPPLVFWVREASTGSFAKKRGIARGGNLAPSADVQLVVCAAKGNAGAAPSPPCMISGTAGGGLCLWRGRNCSLAVKDAHLGAVEVLSVGTLAQGGGAVVASGGRDAKVRLWSSVDLSPLATLDVVATSSVAGLRQVRSVCLSSDGTKVLVGTLGSDILELATVEKTKGEDGEDDGEEAPADDAEEGEEGAVAKATRSGIGRVLNGGQPLVCGHCKGETKGVDGELNSVDVSPQGDQFVTVGDDGTVRVWSNGEKKVLKAFNIGSPALSVSYSPDASLIAVGLAGGGVSVVKPSEEDVTTLQLEKHLDAFPGVEKASSGGATCVRFSPNGATLSAGGGDGSVKAWNTAESDWEAVGSADKVISGSIVGMDFTTDGQFLMINSSGMEMVVVKAETCKKASPKDMKALRGEGEGGEVATWATSTCTMTDGKQAAWATMLLAGDESVNSNSAGNLDETIIPPHRPRASAVTPSDTPSVATATLTGSDLVKGGETPVLLACDSLGRVGLLRYPAQLPPLEPALAVAPPAVADPPTAEGEAVGDGANGAAAGDAPSSEEKEAAAAAAAAASDTMVRAIEAAVPRLSIMKAHAGKVAAVRQIGEGGGVITLGATDRCVYQWAVALEDGEESGEELPDPPACNAPAPKPSAGGEGEDGEEEEEADGGDEEDGERPAAAAWSGDDEDLVGHTSAKRGSRFFNGTQDMSTFVAQRDSAESSKTPPPLLAWLDGKHVASQSNSPCIPDEDLELEWIHGYSAQGSRQNLAYNRNGEIIYPAACAGVIMTKRTKPLQHRQAFNLDHTQAITCLSMHPDKSHVATGQEGSSPVVLVWNSASKPPKTKARLQ
ncbi:unnamed protein product, partial [Hapterophycus canaliculatus]